MSDPESTADDAEGIGREEMMTALFAQMVMQQANLAMMLMGKVPHPQTKERMRDLEGARLFIDQLEMLEAKTRGNLNKDEERLLKDSLMSLQMAFVEAAGGPPPADAAKPPPANAAGANPPEASPGAAAPDEEARKRFSKKY